MVHICHETRRWPALVMMADLTVSSITGFQVAVRKLITHSSDVIFGW